MKKKLRTPMSVLAGVLNAFLMEWVFVEASAGEVDLYLGLALSVLVGVLSGFLFGFLYDLLTKDRPLQHPLIPLICALILAGLVFGGWTAFLLTAATALLTFALAAYAMRELYRGSWRAATRDLWRIAQGKLAGAQVIEDGQSTYPKGEQSPVGPREVTIKPYNAVIFEMGTRQTRISGPARLTTIKSEAVKHIYDLRPRRNSWPFTNVLTRDLIPVEVTVSLSWRINVPPEAARGSVSFQRKDKDIIQKLNRPMADCERGVQVAIEESVRAVVGALNLQALRQQNARDLERQIRNRANRNTRSWGIAVDRVTLENLQLARQMTEAATGNWVTTRQGQAVATADLVRANARASALQALAAAYKSATRAGMPADAVEWESWRRTLEQMAKDLHIKLR